jgi:hypothetical protein
MTAKEFLIKNDPSASNEFSDPELVEHFANLMQAYAEHYAEQSVPKLKLSEKLQGMRKWVLENFNTNAASGASTVITEIESWMDKN